jgi:hypothetical protein
MPLALYVLLMLLGRAPVSFANSTATTCGPDDQQTATSLGAYAERGDYDKKSYAAEWDEDDDYHTSQGSFQAAHPGIGTLRRLAQPDFGYLWFDAHGVLCRGPPRA